MKAIILQGLPGSGKTTWAQNMFKDAGVLTDEKTGTVICCADDYFIKDGQYNFDPSKLDAAHTECFSRFSGACALEVGRVICANTNTHLWEMSPYVALAKLFGYELEFHRFECSPQTSITRNLHGVPSDVIMRMYERMEKPLPFWGELTVHHT